MSTSVRELRRRAFAALKATWPILLALHCFINLISYLAGRLSGIPFLGLLVSLLLSVPTMGILRGKLDYLRGTPLRFDCFSSMFPRWTKVICFELWVMLFTFLWMLPGFIMTFLGIAIIVLAEDGGVGAGAAALIFMVGGIALMLVLLFRAMLNYAVGSGLFVDDPDMGGLTALEKSKAMMRGNRWRFVKMNLPIFLLELVLVLLIGLLGDSWVAPLLPFVMNTVIVVLQAYFQPVFYRDLLGEG